MLRFLSRWRPGHLLAAWSAYWAGLAAVTITSVALALQRASRLGGPPNSTDLGLNFGTKSGFTVTISHLGHQVFQATAGPLPIALAIGVPPLLLWAAWLHVRTREPDAARRPGELGAGAEAFEPAKKERETARR